MTLGNAREFLAMFGLLFTHPVAREWVWNEGDDDFGKSVSWVITPASVDEVQAEVSASIDLQLTQLQLVVSERSPGDSAVVVFSVLVQFEEQSLVVNGEAGEFAEAAISEAIQEFNERTASL